MARLYGQPTFDHKEADKLNFTSGTEINIGLDCLKVFRESEITLRVTCPLVNSSTRPVYGLARLDNCYTLSFAQLCRGFYLQ